MDGGSAMEPKQVVCLQGISKVFHSAGQDFTALKDICIEIHSGEFVCVLGRSGSGKSTLMNMITGIDKPTAGEVVVHGVSVGGMSEDEMARWRGRNLGIVFQFYQLLPVLSLLENVMLPMQIAGNYEPLERERRARSLLAQVGLADQAGQRPDAVSGGEQQCAAVARALANDPPIIVADEPTGNLDSVSAGKVFEVFATLAQQGKTIIMVTHDDELASQADRILRLSDGELERDTNGS